MKANELMIGDWVFSYGRPRQVEIVYDERIQADCIELSEIEFEPIPITAEILEKNGFRYNDMPFVQGWEQFGLTLYHSSNGYLINCGQNVAMKINAVHELQHALQLCKIDKTIEL